MGTGAASGSGVVAAYLDAVMRRDAAAVEELLDEKVEYVVNGTPAAEGAGGPPPISAECQAALPWLGLHRGREAVKEFLAHMHRNLEVTAFGPREVVSEGNRGAAFGWFRLRSLSTGRTADIAYSILFEFRDGRITKYHFLENTFDVARAFRSGGWWVVETDGAGRTIPPSGV